MKIRNFVYTGEHLPDLNAPEYDAFLFHFQKSILRILEKQGLLTHGQTEQCLSQLEKECRPSSPAKESSLPESEKEHKALTIQPEILP